MRTERFLVTGALGCIGAWVVRRLLHEGTPVVVFDLGRNIFRLSLLLSAEEINQIIFIHEDISTLASVEKTYQENRITNVIHLAALQMPFCKADPSLGALVNVVGTVNIFEAAKRTGIKQIVYASSTAVYGVGEEYPNNSITHNSPLKPRSHYGVYKQANEGTAKVYWMDDGISSIGLRPYVVYGAGRDQGLTSTTTKAILAVVDGQNYRISYGGRYSFQYADDVADCFIRSSRVSFDGSEVFNIGGPSVSTEEVVSAIEAALPNAEGKIGIGGTHLPFPEQVDNDALAAVIGRPQFTPLYQGIADTIDIFKKAINEGKIHKTDIDRILQSP